MAHPDETSLPFWGGDYPPASLSEIEETERHIGHRLPDPYRQLLLTQNGGVSNYGGFVDGGRRFPLFPIFGAGTNARHSIIRAFDMRQMEGRPEGVVLIAAKGHSWIGLDYRQSGEEPAVVVGNTDEDEVKLLAPSFAALMKGLVEEMPL
jgi:hypothetical protein